MQEQSNGKKENVRNCKNKVMERRKCPEPHGKNNGKKKISGTARTK